MANAKRILYIEDNPNDWDLTSRYLKKHAPQLIVELAENLREAKLLLGRKTYDVLLIDYQLPDGEGVSLIPWTQDRGISCGIIVVTAHSGDKNALAVLKAGADDYLRKQPGYFERLPATIDHVFIRLMRRRRYRQHSTRVLYGENDDSRWHQVHKYLKINAPHIRLQRAPDGATCIDLLTEESFNTVIFRYKMPDISGLDLLKDVKLLKPNLPVILSSMSRKEEAVIQSIKLGASDYIVQEGDYPERLIHAIDRVVFQSRLEESERDLRKEIQDRKRKEEEIARLASVVEQAVEAVIIINSEGVVQYANSAFTQLMGTSETNPTDQHFEAFLGTENKELIRTLLWVIENGEVWSGSISITSVSGSRVNTESNISPIRNVNGKIISYSAVVRDVTHEKELEKRLLQSQKMEAIGTLAGGIAHDFNNILGAIIGHVEIMELFEQTGTGTIQNSLNEILNASYRAKDLVNQILAFSRESRQEKKAILLHPIIKESIKLLRASLPATIEIRQNIQKVPGTVIADPTQMQQVVMNLCTNAAHAMQESGGVLEVMLTTMDKDTEATESFPDLEPGRYVWLSVKDSGYGMSPEVMARCFDPYFTTKHQGEGTGLGLSMVHGIVSSHGGTISMESEKSKGTTFHIFLPLMETKLYEATRREKKPLMGGMGRVMFVDDEKSLVKLGTEILERLGYEVVTRTSSVEASEAIRARPDSFDLVITDMTMPNMTGLELARFIYNLRPELPIILCTGFSERITKELAKSAGIRAVLQKPIGVRILAETIHEVLGETN